ncbi:MAG: outer membrane beta-barrel protein [Bradyrhizobium sp.]|uniref:outer membrane protein n=1 Tax=Bradyrhizobium sp. TaxID=376 RepID=UPI0027283068|nr:outer membrane beta-barrel protein [Bradyrhizobium sp.]MDO9058538.1 outer membrane beta-barrel protein [Bradyrhizobium sp.]MDP3694413.1 outer membrane beta-barrel protein [Bradyrhizobium sp.]
MHTPTRISVLVRSCAAFVAAASVVFTATAHAGDAPVVRSLPSWTGFYAGVHGGWGWGKTQVEDPIFSPPFNPTESTYSGPLAGGQFGANWQLGNFVVGAEIDGSWAFVRGNTNRNQTIITSSTNNGIGYRALATGTGRLGYAMGQWLAYAKGGVAWADMEITTQFTPLPTTYERRLFGAVGGVGLEVAFLRNVSAKVEYNLIYIPTDHLVYANLNTTSSLDHLVQVVKAGINVRFGDGSVPAR